jgi:putative MATE family efflux protein
MGIQFMQMTYNLTDMFWLGKLSTGAVAASGTAGMFLWLSQAFLMVGRMGAEIGVSQSLGHRDPDAAYRYSLSSLWLAVALGVGYALLLVAFRTPLVGFFRIQEARVAQDAADYLAVVAAGIPFTFVTGALSGTFNAAGNSRISFYANCTGLVFNIIFDPVFIFGLGMGIMGAAVATLLGQALVASLFLCAIRKSKNRPFGKYPFFCKPQPGYVRQIVVWSLPVALESLLFTFLAMPLSRFVASFGVEAMAAHRVGSQIESLSWLVGGGFATAVTAFVGQNFGAGKWERISRGYRIAILAMAGWGAFVTVVLVTCGQPMVGLFLAEPGAISLGQSFLRILATCQIIACLEFTSAGTFRGIGRTVPPSFVSITSNILRLPLAYVLAYKTPLGLRGVWWGIVIGAIFRGVCIFLWYVVSASKHKNGEMAQGDANARG